MEVKRQKHLVLILAREFASQLSTPVFITDAEGRIVFYNEPAEELLGRTFAESGELAASEWYGMISVETLDGRPCPVDEMPGGIARRERQPAHSTLRITGLDGRQRVIEDTAFPLLGHDDELYGSVAIFWEQSQAR
jgi:PAS domain-containing protein